MKKIINFLIFIVAISPFTVYGVYQSDDPSVYMEPGQILCDGIKNYPSGIRINIPHLSTVGNLESGLQYLYPEGKMAVYIFNFTGTGGDKKLEYKATRIDFMDWQRLEYDGSCKIIQWHSN